ncbi:hypothetical protein Bca4012_083919 [Brassica carinata]
MVKKNRPPSDLMNVTRSRLLESKLWLIENAGVHAEQSWLNEIYLRTTRAPLDRSTTDVYDYAPYTKDLRLLSERLTERRASCVAFPSISARFSEYDQMETNILSTRWKEIARSLRVFPRDMMSVLQEVFMTQVIVVANLAGDDLSSQLQARIAKAVFSLSQAIQWLFCPSWLLIGR